MIPGYLFNLLRERKGLPALRKVDVFRAMDLETKLRVQPDEPLTNSGWTRREVDAIQYPEGIEAAQKHLMLATHWLEVWRQEDAAEQAKQLAAKEAQKARDALWASQAPERERLARDKAARDKARLRNAQWIDDGPPGALGAIKQDDLTIETDQQRRALVVVGQPVDDDLPQTICLFGTPGTGKSSLAAVWLRQAFAAGLDVQWITCFDFDKEVRGRHADEVIERCEWTGALVVDDIEADISDHAKREIAEMFDRRRQEGGRTCFTTNLTTDQLRQVFSPRNYSRLMGGAELLLLTGRDYRLTPVLQEKCNEL